MATKVITGKARLSYEHIWTPKCVQADQQPKFSCQVLIPKTDLTTLNAVKAAIQAETEVAYPNGKLPANFKVPLKDGDTVGRSETAGCWVLNPSSKSAPGIIDANRQDIIDKSLVYSGCYCRFQLAFAPYKLPTSCGVGVYLNNIQKVSDGPSLAGRDAAADVFDAYSDDAC